MRRRAFHFHLSRWSVDLRDDEINRERFDCWREAVCFFIIYFCNYRATIETYVTDFYHRASRKENPSNHIDLRSNRDLNSNSNERFFLSFPFVYAMCSFYHKLKKNIRVGLIMDWQGNFLCATGFEKKKKNKYRGCGPRG